MQKFLFLLVAGLIFAGITNAQLRTFISEQVGSGPVNGELLQTNGSSSTWVATSTLNINATSLGSATSTEPFMAAYFVATSTTATSTFAGGVQFDDLIRLGSGDNLSFNEIWRINSASGDLEINRASGSGNVDLNGTDLVVDQIGLCGSSINAARSIDCTVSGSTITFGLALNITFSGTTANLRGISNTIDYTGTNANPNVINEYTSDLSADPSTSGLARGLFGLGSLTVAQTNAGNRSAIGGYFDSNIIGSHTNGYIQSFSLYATAPANPNTSGSATEARAAGVFNGDTVVTTDNKVILEGSVANEAATTQAVTIGDSYLSFGAASTTIVTDGNTNFNLTSATTTQQAGDFRLTATTTRLLGHVGGNNTFGTTTLSSGAATVLTPMVRSDSLIFLSNCLASGSSGILSVGTITAGVSFVVNSTNILDTSRVCYMLVQPIY